MNIIFSIDIETNGIVAGINSMISLGAAAMDMDAGQVLASFKVNLQCIPELQVDEDTMRWWKTFPEAYRASTINAVEPALAMERFERWVVGFGIDKPTCAAWKPAFDIGFLRYYAMRYLRHDIFGRSGSGLDIKTVTAIALNWKFSETQISKVPDNLRVGYSGPHTHDAQEDAIEQGFILCNAAKKLGVQL